MGISDAAAEARYTHAEEVKQSCANEMPFADFRKVVEQKVLKVCGEVKRSSRKPWLRNAAASAAVGSLNSECLQFRQNKRCLQLCARTLKMKTLNVSWKNVGASTLVRREGNVVYLISGKGILRASSDFPHNTGGGLLPVLSIIAVSSEQGCVQSGPTKPFWSWWMAWTFFDNK